MAETKVSYVYVCSKLACDNAYATYGPGAKAANGPGAKAANDLPKRERQVLIKGGSGVIDKNLVTPHGIVTKITAEELEMLRKNCPGFVRHEKAGFLKVLDKDPSVKEVASMANDMPDDNSKQKTEKDTKKKAL